MRRVKAFTLVELLVVISIIGMLVAILLPAVNAARGAARLTTCKNHLRQQAIGLRSFAQQFPEQLPALWRGKRIHPWENYSWRLALLPFIEEDNRYEQIHKDLPPLDPKNAAVIGPIDIFACPSSPSYPRIIRELGPAREIAAGPSDYAPVFEVRPSFEPISKSGTWYGGSAPDSIPPGFSSVASDFPEAGIMLPNEPARADEFNAEIRSVASTFRLVRDGLSNTVLLVEQAGKPARLGNQHVFDPTPTEGAWVTAEYASYFASGINQNNYAGPYGFHNGVTVAMCDASIHFWSKAIDARVMTALLTRAGSEIVSEADWK